MARRRPEREAELINALPVRAINASHVVIPTPSRLKSFSLVSNEISESEKRSINDFYQT